MNCKQTIYSNPSNWGKIFRSTLFLCAALLGVPSLVQAQIITTVAGDGVPRFSGDGGPAASGSLNQPFGVAADGFGNRFIADQFNQRIRRVDAVTGIITTLAGDGYYGFTGHGPATSARVNYPWGVTLDGSGNLFIADTGNTRIRRVDAVTGIITTVAGNGTFGFSGDGGPATDASFYSIKAVAVDCFGNLFITDYGNHRIRRVDAATGIITTVAGDGVPRFSGDDGPATSASLYAPQGVAVDGSGDLFIADRFNYRIRQVDGVTGIITTVAGNGVMGFSGDDGPATDASLNEPFSVVVDSSAIHQQLRLVFGR